MRSPAEFAEDHVPGALNCPVLDDDERAAIGTLYKQVSPFDAKKLGAALVARNIARHLETSVRAARPRLAAARLLLARRQALRRDDARAARDRLAGGAARGRLQGLPARGRGAARDRCRASFRYRVVCGETGSAQEPPAARRSPRGARRCSTSSSSRAHRGSVLGDLPERAAAVAEDVRDPASGTPCAGSTRRVPVFVEAESKKIGQLQVPDALLETHARRRVRARRGAGRGARARSCIDEYRHFLADPAALKTQLDCLIGLYGRGDHRPAGGRAPTAATGKRSGRGPARPNALRPGVPALDAQELRPARGRAVAPAARPQSRPSIAGARRRNCSRSRRASRAVA